MISSGDTASGRLGPFLVNCALLVVAVIFFALPQPNLLSLHGFPIVGWFAFVPLFLLVRRISFRSSFLWGALYGILCYCVFTYWLAVFHPLAMYIIAALYCLWMLAVVPLLKLADRLFPRKGYILQWALWVGYEYLKTKGFNGYSYGVIGYSQWSWPVIIQIASIFGVWGVSALITFPSAWFAASFKDRVSGPVRGWAKGFRDFARRERVPAFIWSAALVATLVYGLAAPRDYSGHDTVSVALIQPNSDPWVGGIRAYERDFTTLTRLSDEALAAHPETELVVWPETAFIPRIEWHYKYRENRESFDLVVRLLDYLDAAPVPFVLGNDDGVLEPAADGNLDRADYNSVFLFRPGVNVIPPEPERYRKMHLVPFTEHFPYRKAFPWVYDLLVANDTHFWEKGTDVKVFNAAGLSFSSPICFEDTFGYISRRFVNAGARAIVNLTNDAWAASGPSQWQHMSMAVFRAVENRVPLVRSTASGQTCMVDPNGRVVAMAPAFEEAYLVCRVPVLDELPKTFYRIWGDLWGILFAAVSSITLVTGMLTRLRNM
ncbi:MAG TPA: apolipoprotein N-acyltransferase [Treponemataceae bacterium]|nr:apolipoprotein N-acyltransferase [Treponemataceae bacterium]HPL92600.1 apolipoprotein N-acyltransferase [Treponemataceae bacterium]